MVILEKDPKSGLRSTETHSGAISCYTLTTMATTAIIDRLLVILPLFFLYLFGSFAGLRVKPFFQVYVDVLIDS